MTKTSLGLSGLPLNVTVLRISQVSLKCFAFFILRELFKRRTLGFHELPTRCLTCCRSRKSERRMLYGQVCVKMQRCCSKKEDLGIDWSGCRSTAPRRRELTSLGCRWIETDIASLCRRVSLNSCVFFLWPRSGVESGLLVNEPSCCLLLTLEDLSFDVGAAAQLAVMDLSLVALFGVCLR